jgi:hypothetical protein
VSSWVGQSTWTCIKNANYNFAIVREFMQTCQVDPNGVHTVANAWAAGLAHVDVSSQHKALAQCAGVCAVSLPSSL